MKRDLEARHQLLIRLLVKRPKIKKQVRRRKRRAK